MISFFRIGLFLILGVILSGRSYSRDTLTIAVYNSAPFGFEYDDGVFGGLMVKLWESINEELDYPSKYELTDMSTLIHGLHVKRYDLGLGAISITPSRERLVDFSHAVNPSGTGIATSADSSGTAFKSYWKPILFSLFKLIGSLLLVLFVSGFVVYIVERRSQKEQTDRSITGFADALWWSAVTMTTVGYGDKVPVSRLGRILGIIWIFTSIILLSLFTANASAVFTATRSTAHIQTQEDLRRSKVGAARNSSGAEYLKREHVMFYEFDHVNGAIDAMLSGEIDCVVSNVPVLKHLNHTSYYGKLAVSPTFLMKNNMGIAMQEDSPLREKVNLILLKKIAEPFWQEELYKYLGEIN